MRVWPATLAIIVACSGCIGGHATGIPREADDNGTIQAAGMDGGVDDAPPWALKDGAPKEEPPTKQTPTKENESKPPGGEDPEEKDPGSGEQPGDTSDDGLGLPGGDTGASGTGDLEQTVDETLDDQDVGGDSPPESDDVVNSTESTVNKTLG